MREKRLITSIHRYGEWGIVALCAGVYLALSITAGLRKHRRASPDDHRPEDWYVFLSWIQQPGDFSSGCSFFLTWASANANAQGDRSAVSPLLKEAYRNGIPGILDGIVFVEI